MHPPTTPTTLALSALLLLPSALGEGLYAKSSPVLQLDGRTYRSQIEQSNHTSLIEFYAPWCGHCKNLKPAFEKAATSLTGLAKVGAVNCDAEENKPFCGSMGVQGFPTLKLVKPGKKAGKPIVEDYRGERTAKAMVDAVVDKIPNHVKRLKDADYEEWLEGNADRPKAILFSSKGSTSALLKALAIDFLGVLDVAQIRDKEVQAVEVFAVEKFPSLVLLPGEGKDPVHYDGEMKKADMLAFLSQAATPNPDPAPKKAKTSSKTDKSKASASSSKFSSASASHKSADSSSSKATQTSEVLEDDSNPTESPSPEVVTDDTQKPIKLPEVAPPIPSLPDTLSLQRQCLNSKAGTCILALLPADGAESPDATTGLASLASVHHKHAQAGRKLFPFYQLTGSASTDLKAQLSLDAKQIAILAVNGKKAWARHFGGPSYSQASVEDWIDALRMGDAGPKASLPEGVVVAVEDLPAAEERKAGGGKEEVKINLGKDGEGIKNAMKGQMPEGVDFEIEEVSDEEYERLMAQKGEEEGGHEEL